MSRLLGWLASKIDPLTGIGCRLVQAKNPCPHKGKHRLPEVPIIVHTIFRCLRQPVLAKYNI